MSDSERKQAVSKSRRCDRTTHHSGGPRCQMTRAARWDKAIVGPAAIFVVLISFAGCFLKGSDVILSFGISKTFGEYVLDADNVQGELEGAAPILAKAFERLEYVRSQHISNGNVNWFSGIL